MCPTSRRATFASSRPFLRGGRAPSTCPQQAPTFEERGDLGVERRMEQEQQQPRLGVGGSPAARLDVSDAVGRYLDDEREGDADSWRGGWRRSPRAAAGRDDRFGVAADARCGRCTHRQRHTVSHRRA